MGVSHEKLDRICHVTCKHRLHSKLTGAGGGGCAVTLLRPDTPQEVIYHVVKDLTEEGFKCFQTIVGGPGVTATFVND